MLVTRIAIVEDDLIVRDRFAALLGAADGCSVVGAFADVAGARQYLQRHPVDVLLVDLGLPDDDGISLIRLCTVLQPRCECIVVTILSDSDRVFASLEAGASGYVLKDEIPGDIVDCVRTVVAGGSPVSPSIARRLLRRLKGFDPHADAARSRLASSGLDEPLSARELEMLELVAKGLSLVEIATLLRVSRHTVGTHVKNIYRKLSVHSRTEAVFEARELGLLRR